MFGHLRRDALGRLKKSVGVKGFILAAGEGRRLRPYTDSRPKPMIEIGGRPLLEYNVRALAEAGITRIFINTHYRPEVIERYFGNGDRFGVQITYLYEPVLLGTAGALLPIADEFDSRFIVLYGDNVTDCDLTAVIARHDAAAAFVTIASFYRDDVLGSGIVDIDDDGFIVRFLEKPRPDEVFSHWVNAGIMVAEPGVLNAIPRGRSSDFGQDVLPALLGRGARLAAYRMHEHLWWIDSVADYERARLDPELRRFTESDGVHRI
jgi:NDP-sugar pyrophosphorylase family protein